MHIALSLLIGLPAFVLGALIRAGRLRTFRGGLWVAKYRNATWPWDKNGFFMLLPIGIGCLLMAAGFVAFELDARRTGLALLLGVGIATLMAFYIGGWAPWWSKPRWIRDEEADRVQRRVDRGQPPKKRRTIRSML